MAKSRQRNPPRHPDQLRGACGSLSRPRRSARKGGAYNQSSSRTSPAAPSLNQRFRLLERGRSRAGQDFQLTLMPTVYILTFMDMEDLDADRAGTISWATMPSPADGMKTLCNL